MYDKFRKDDGNDMAVDVAQRESSNVKCYTSAFSIYIDIDGMLCSKSGLTNWFDIWQVN